jgi:hypothetical protein
MYDSNSIELTSKQKIFNSTVGLHLNNSTQNLEKIDQRNGKAPINNKDYERDFNVLNNLQDKPQGIQIKLIRRFQISD